LSKIIRLPVCGAVSSGLNITDALQLLPGASVFLHCDLITNNDGVTLSIVMLTPNPVFLLPAFLIVTVAGLLTRPTAVLVPKESDAGLIVNLPRIGVGVALAVAVEVLVAVAVGVVVGVAVAVEVGLPAVAVGVLVVVVVLVAVGAAVAVGVAATVEVGVGVGVAETVGEGPASGWSYSSTRLLPLSTM